jgi:hypothetical protein
MRTPIEADVEQAVVKVIEAQLVEDGHNDTPVTAITLGSPGDEAEYPMVHVGCAPVEHKGATVKDWTGQMVISIRTKHLTGKDRDASTLVSLLGSVGYALDFGNFSQHAEVVNSIHAIRETGDYEFADSTNAVNIPCRLLICGLKSA